jgi:hypothetical protein
MEQRKFGGLCDTSAVGSICNTVLGEQRTGLVAWGKGSTRGRVSNKEGKEEEA